MAAVEVAKDIGGSTIGHFECTGDDALVTFGSTSGDTRISQAYDHLMMTLSVRATHSTYESGVNVDFNNGTGYSYIRLQTLAGALAAANNTGAAYGQWAACAGASVEAQTFASAVVWLPHYANSTNKKSWFTRSIIPTNSTSSSQSAVQMEAGLWGGTDAITEIDLSPASGSFVQYSNFTLYGVTGI